MKHGVYIGTNTQLIGKGALIQDDLLSRSQGVLAQFDDISLREAFNWHPFYSYEFRVNPEIDWSKDEK